MNLDPDRAIRTATAAVVTAVAAFGAVQSYTHIYGLARGHGQDMLDARLLPLSVDGLILASSLVILHQARRRGDTPWNAWAMLGLGVAATLAANVLSGLPAGWLSACIAAWPAVAFIGAIEIDMWMIRRARSVPVPTDDTVSPDAESAAEVSLRATLAAGNPWSGRQLETRFGLTRAQATKVRQAVLGETNGQAPDEALTT